MKITEVQALIVRQPEVSLIGDGTQDSVIIRIDTDAGIYGVAEVDSAPFLVKQAIDMPDSHSAQRGMRNVLLGMDPMETEVIWDALYAGTYYYARGGAGMHAISGIDMALWDIRGKALGVPVYTLLGGARQRRVPAYISILMPATEEEVKRLVDYHMAKGYSGIKFGWGNLGDDGARDLRLIRAARKALGPDKLLMIDIAMNWKEYKPALDACRAYEQEGVYWVEEPFRVERRKDFAKLRQATRLAITAGEELSALDEFEAYLEEGCVDILQPDLSRCGGLTVAKKVMELAKTHQVPIIPHNFKSGLLMSATLQFIAALPQAKYLEYCGQETVLSRSLVQEPVTVTDGCVEIPDRPGLGVELNMDTVNRYRVG
ncbi:MAG: mandelate racemase/muconate lactonizing enzyme family protein [Clostridiales bacterium]|nr:mandelate racemase/muconate lactonizing enzyme family protein [Clostridiales bacterium]